MIMIIVIILVILAIRINKGALALIKLRIYENDAANVEWNP